MKMRFKIIVLFFSAINVFLVASCTLDPLESGPKDPNYRESTSSSKAGFDKVYDFLPAPGQFINENYTAKTQAEAIQAAQSILDNNGILSLGAFGGYVVVGFDHSVDNNKGAYDFSIKCNSFTNNSEPGIVWVMQDENGNGIPDDTWYELKGSEYGNSSVYYDYEVTYFRPESSGMDVKWEDNNGNSGTIDYQTAYHKQGFYYPLWINNASYTLKGTRLPGRTEDVSGNGTKWQNHDFDWGYADNYGSDLLEQENRFDIDNAIKPGGIIVSLSHIDFIKVQTAISEKAGWTGELSTEVRGFTDL